VLFRSYCLTTILPRAQHGDGCPGDFQFSMEDLEAIPFHYVHCHWQLYVIIYGPEGDK
jgi:hypothetical protein